MRKRYLKIEVVLLCLILLCSILTHTYALEPYASSQISGHSATLDKGTDGYLYVTFMIRTNRVMNKLGASSVIIQRYSLFQWVNERIYTPDDMPELMRSNTGYFFLSIPYDPLFPNAKYRAVVNFYAESDIMTSTVTETTNTVPKTA